MKRNFFFLVTTGLLLTALGCASTGGDSATGERFQGRLAALSGPGGGQTAYLNLHANRYATDAEVEAFAKILVEGGEKALYSAVVGTEPMGWVRIGDNTRYHLRVIRTVDTPEGRIIRGITDRPIQFGEIIRPLRSREYTFGIIELQLDEAGKGSGGIIAAAQISFNGTSIEIESFGNQPYRVMAVKPIALK